MDRSRIQGFRERGRLRDGPFGEPLIERDRELSVVRDRLSQARDGAGSAVVVSGEAGAGKSALLRAAQEESRRAGLRVLFARGLETEQDFAFGLALRLIEPAILGLDPVRRQRLFTGPARAAVQLFEGARADDFAEGSDRAAAMVHALSWVIRRLVGPVEGGPAATLVVVDDLHWADGPSARLLARLAGLVDDQPLVLMVATRNADRAGAELPDRLAALPWSTSLPLTPLSVDAVRLLVRQVLDGAADAFVGAVSEIAGGNPLYVEQLVTAAVDGELEGRTEDVPGLHELVPSMVQGRIALLLQALPPDTVAFADALAVLGDETSLRLVAALAGLTASAAERAAEALMAGGLVRAEEPLSFRHPLDRTAVYERIHPLVRSRAHRRAADLLSNDGSAIEAVGSHLLLCRTDADPRVVDLLRQAADRAGARGNYGGARRLLIRALSEPPASSRDRGELMADLALAEVALGNPAAISQMTEALELVEDPARRAALISALARLQFTLSRFEAAADSVTLARAELPDGHPMADEIRWDELLLAAFVPARQAAAAEQVRRLAAGVLEGAERPASPALLGLVATAMVVDGSPARDVRRVATAALHGVSGRFQELSVAQAVLALLAVDEPDLAAPAIEATLSRAEGDGSLIGLGFGTHWRAALRMQVGDLVGAIADAERNLDIARAGWGICRNWVVPILATALIELGQFDDAAEALHRCDDAQGVERALVLEARARLDLARGDPGPALEQLSTVGALIEGNVSVLPAAVSAWRSLAAVAALGVGDRERAAELAAHELAWARRVGARLTLGVALRSAGLVAEESVAGIALLTESVAVLRPSSSRLEFARSLVELGVALRRSGALSQGREALREGIGLAEQCGAEMLAARATEELRAAGGRRSSSRVTSGGHLLTLTEHEVVRLAASGRPTREIAQELYLSPKTVGWHLSNAYRKLGVQSRRQLSGLVDVSDNESTGESAG